MIFIMKKICFFISVLLVAISCESPLSSVNDLTLFALNGDVSSVREDIYTSIEKDGEYVQDQFVMSTVQEFNESGYMTKEESFDRYGKQASESTRIYDENNLLIEKAERTSSQYFYTSKVFARKKNLIGWQKSNGDVLAVRRKGLVEKELFRDETLIRETKYNKDFRCVSERVFNPKNGAVTREIKNNYDGKLIKEQSVITNGDTFTSTYEYKSFDANGNWTKAFISDGELDGEMFVYIREISYR